MELEHEVVISAPTVDEATILGLARLGLTRGDAEVEVLDEGSKGFLGIGIREARVLVRRRLQPEGVAPAASIETAPDKEQAGSQEMVISQFHPGSLLKSGAGSAEKPPLDDAAKGVKTEKLSAEGPQSEKTVSVQAPTPATAGTELEPAPIESVGEFSTSPERSDERNAMEAIALEVARHFFEALDLQVTADWREDDRSTLWVAVRGKDADVLVGPHAQTLDSVQHLLRTVVRHKAHGLGRGNREFDLVLDADGYRERRLRSLATLACNTADKAVKQGKPIQLRSMSAADRRVIHITLRNDHRVRTQSTGSGHSRAVTVFPVDRDGKQ